MNRTFSKLAAAAALVVCGQVLASETSIKTAASSEVIRVRNNATVNIELTGTRTDVVFLRVGGQLTRMFTLAQAIAGGAHVVSLGNGVYRVRIQMVGYSAVNGGALVLRSSAGAVIDSDPIVVN